MKKVHEPLIRMQLTVFDHNAVPYFRRYNHILHGGGGGGGERKEEERDLLGDKQKNEQFEMLTKSSQRRIDINMNADTLNSFLSG